MPKILGLTKKTLFTAPLRAVISQVAHEYELSNPLGFKAYLAEQESSRPQLEYAFGDESEIAPKHLATTLQSLFYIYRYNKTIFNSIDLLIVDEIDYAVITLPEFVPPNDIMKNCAQILNEIITTYDIYVVGITATNMDRVAAKFPNPNIIKFQEELRKMVHKETKYREIYSLLDELLPKHEKKGEGIILYADRIEQCKRFQDYIEEKGYRAEAIWSLQNPLHSMRDTALELRKALESSTTNYDFPQVLIINASLSRGISFLMDYYTTVIVHSQVLTTQEQVVGRVRRRKKLLTAYFLDKSSSTSYPLPSDFFNKYLGVQLNSKKRKELADYLNWKNNCNRRLQWESIKSILIKEHGLRLIKNGRNYEIEIRTGEE